MLIEKVPFYTSFESLSGFVKYKTQQSFDQSTEAQVNQLMSEQVSLPAKEFEDLKAKLVSKFMKEYESEIVGDVTESMAKL